MQITEKQTYKIRYLIVPDFVFQNPRLTLLSVKLYSFIHGYRAPEFFFSNEKLAEIFDCDERSIRRAVSQLTEEGYISWEQPNGRKRFIIDLWADKDVLPGGTKLSSHVQAEGGTDVSSQNVPNEGSNRRESDENGNPNKNIFNKNSLAKNLEIPDEEFKDKEWLEKRRAHSERRASGNSTRVGSGNHPRSTPSYKEKKSGYSPKVVVDAEDVI